MDLSDENTSVNDQELLLKIMETQERLEEDPSESDLKEMENENTKNLKDSFSRISEALDRKDWSFLKEEATKAQYFTVIQNRIKEKIPIK